MEMNVMTNEIKKQIAECEKLLIGIGAEWKMEKRPEAKQAYESLYQLIQDKDYFIVTTNTDGAIYDFGFNKHRIVAPCGNENWRQCSKACTKDIWEAGELPEDICPHCGAPLTGNTIEAETYIEEGYLPQWQLYTSWLTTTLNRKLLVLELGEGFRVPTVIRWPFEKTVFFNQKSHFIRVHETLSQISEEIKDRAKGISEHSITWVIKEDKV